MTPKHLWEGKYVWVAVFAAALIVRLAYLISYANHLPFVWQPITDSLVYLNKAKELLVTGWLGKDVFFHSSPLYIYFLGVLVRFFPHDALFLAPLVQCLAGSLSCVVVALYASALFDRRVGIVAGIASALYGPLVFFDAELLEISLVIFFVTVLLLCVELYEKSLEKKHLLTAAVMLGLASLGKPNTLLILPILGLYLWFKSSPRPGRLRLILLWVFLPTMLVIAPFTLRNAIVGRDFVAISSNGGINFYIGNHEGADGIFSLPFEISGMNRSFYEPDNQKAAYSFEEATHQRAERDVGRPLRPSEVSNYWFWQGASFWQNHPKEALGLLLRKTLLLVNRYEIPNHSNYYLSRAMIFPLRLAFLDYWLLLPMAVAGLALALFKKRRLGFLPWYLMGYGISLLPFFIAERYRLPLIPGLLALGAYFLVETAGTLADGMTAGRWKPAALWVGFGVFAIMLVLTHLPNQLNETRFLASAHISVGTSYSVQKKYRDAQRHFEQACLLDPADTACRRNLILARYYLNGGKPVTSEDIAAANRLCRESLDLMRSGRYGEAVELLDRAAHLDPISATPHQYLAQIHYNAKDYRNAARSLADALERDPSNELFRSNLAVIEDLLKNSPGPSPDAGPVP